MTGPDIAQLYLGLLLFGVFCAACFFLLAWLTQLAKQALLWVDDEKSEGPFPMTMLIAKLCGYTHNGGDSSYFDKKGKTKDSSDFLFFTALGIVFVPIAVKLSIEFYPVALALALLYCIAHTARFARRHKKLFDKHIKDPEAHK